ncbi:histidine phosphatase family protein [Pelagibius sp.]|uniref:histidine phosphatase family protein n=1 Tax=Pelagibius sp. TaxID=1931238 RepID=UPI00262E3829|nr:histidine phosphatase family protein [Pelagibius sp.]
MRAAFLAIALSVVGSIWSSGTAAQDVVALQRLAEPRTHALMRHALAPGTGDPANFALGDCTTQRNLNDAGRAQARAAGAAVRAAGVTVDHLLTSQWCRCEETARLLDLGPVIEEPALNSFFRDRSTAEDQTEAVRQLLASLPAEETAVLVTHQVNITALTGIFPRSGEFILVTVDDSGTLEVIDRVPVPD